MRAFFFLHERIILLEENAISVECRKEPVTSVLSDGTSVAPQACVVRQTANTPPFLMSFSVTSPYHVTMKNSVRDISFSPTGNEKDGAPFAVRETLRKCRTGVNLTETREIKQNTVISLYLVGGSMFQRRARFVENGVN